MHRWRAVSILVAAVVAPLNGAPQQSVSAGSTRPDLRVLQELPEAQLFPLMNLIADSLGVRCDYCHVQEKPDLTKTPANVGGWVWDSDEKPQKRKAREMMRMMIDLNAGPFRDGTRVTCYTCHRGAAQPARLPALPPALAGAARTPSAPALPSADRVWTNYVNAVGQADNPAPGTATIISGWDDRSEGRFGKVEIVLAGANRYRATVTTPAATSSQGFEGDAAWLTTNDGVLRLSAPDALRLRRIATRYWPLKPRPAGLKVVGIERLTERDAYVATARVDPITTLTMYFDVVTGLLRREVTTTETLLLPLQEQVDYDDYRDVGGTQWPFQVRTSDGSSYSTAIRTFLQIRRNVAVDDALFRPPAGR